MSTYSVPFYKMVGGKRKLMGIVTADVSLTWLQEAVSSIKVLETGYGFLISRNGTLVTHPFTNLIMNETIFGVAEAREDKELGRWEEDDRRRIRLYPSEALSRRRIAGHITPLSRRTDGPLPSFSRRTN